MATAAVAAAASPPALDLCTVLTESKRIINAHSRHFLALSVLFILPPSFILTSFPTLHSLLTHSSTPNSNLQLSTYIIVIQIQDPNDSITLRTLNLSLLFSIFVFLFALLAVGSLSYSVLHGFYGRPVKLVSAIKSAIFSFLPLLVTAIFAEIIISALFLVLGFSIFLVIKGIELVGFQIDYSSPYFFFFKGVVLSVLLFILIKLQLNWALVGVIVAVESSWGLEPLKRSSFLIKGMRGVTLALMLFFGVLAGIILFVSSVCGLTLGVGTDDPWKSSALIVQIVVTSTLLMLLLLYYVAAHTVLYMYCKAIQGELAWEIAEEFAREYVSLPFDDGKVPHLVSVAYN